MMYDAIVVGAGPGGTSAAFFMGHASQKVLVLEKEAVPRYKTCGGGVPIRALEKYFPFSFEPVIDCRVQSISYILGRYAATIPLNGPSMVTVMRDRFDAHILSHAKAEVVTKSAVRKVNEAGAHVMVETHDGRTFVTRAFLEMLSDEVTYPEIILRNIATLPVFLLTEAAAGLLRRFGLADQDDRLRRFVYWGRWPQR